MNAATALIAALAGILRAGSRRALALLVCLVPFAMPQAQTTSRELRTLEALGAALFSDRNLSVTRTQNCVSCHSPQLAFTDPRELGDLRGAVSRGAHLSSFGDRNSPTLMYAALTPALHFAPDGQPVGGFFHDGRAHTLEEQVSQPLLDPVEMAMPGKPAIIGRLKENTHYVEAFQRLFGADALEDERLAIAGLSMALAAHLRSADFMPFDSRYDRMLRGTDQLDAQEQAGQALFFASRGGCATCHASTGVSGAHRDTFSTYRYVNLGVPANAAVRERNGSRSRRIDHGLMATPAAAQRIHDGKFKVPSLRNVAITGPYMHNGIFQDLKTALQFHLRKAGAGRPINPETGTTWGPPEVQDTADENALQAMPALSDQEIEAVIAFLTTLTDRRYERLLIK